MSSSKPDAFSHAPLPYVVVLRRSSGDDTPAETYRFSVIAYSAIQAVFQASFQLNGVFSTEKDKVVVESVDADLERWKQLYEVESTRELSEKFKGLLARYGGARSRASR